MHHAPDFPSPQALASAEGVCTPVWIEQVFVTIWPGARVHPYCEVDERSRMAMRLSHADMVHEVVIDGPLVDAADPLLLVRRVFRCGVFEQVSWAMRPQRAEIRGEES